MKIVSLLPSATEIICSLGLEDSLVGVTHECDYPDVVRGLPKVTRTLVPTNVPSAAIDGIVVDRLRNKRALYELDMPALEALQPDLIVTQALCDVCAVAEAEVREAACMLPGTPLVINLEPESLSEVFSAIQQVADAAGIPAKGRSVVADLVARVDAVVMRSGSVRHRPRVALLEWLDPPYSCGHWNPSLVQIAGGDEGLGADGQRSRRLRWEEVIALQPDVVFISCCGYGVARTLEDLPLLNDVPGWHDLPAVRNGRVYVADGAYYFSRPGPRLVDSLEILAHALHPDVHRLPAGLAPAIAPIASHVQ